MQRIAVICSGQRSQVEMAFDKGEDVDIYELAPQGYRVVGTVKNGDSHLFGPGVWAFKVKHPVSVLSSKASAAVLTTTDEDPWPKPPPPPPPVFASFNEYDANLDALERHLRGK